MVDLDAITITPEVLRLIPKAMAVELSVLPLSAESDGVIVLLPENYDGQVLDDLGFLLGRKVIPSCAPRELVDSAIKKFYGITDLELQRNTVSHAAEFLSVKEREVLPANGEGAKVDSSSGGPIVTLVNRIISDAIRMNASDIHVEPYEESLRIRYRLDGILHEVLQPPVEKTKPILSRLKIMADLDIAEKRRPQDGRIRVNEGDRTIDIRVSTLPTDFGEKIVLRILDKSQLKLDLSNLGFEETDLKLFKRTLRLPYGMILVTGPTGSGKTTTLYAALNHINKPEINITTVEDPIEYNLAGINQIHIRTEIGLTFAAALRSILRQDPNVIMVGEIRDSETAEIAIRAALTGHLVFSTLHTNDAPSAITRLIDMGVQPFLVASSLKMILAQRLLRKLCDCCKIPSQPTAEQAEELHLQKSDPPAQFYSMSGCESCRHLGYNGRTAVYEVLKIHNDVSDSIAKGVSASVLRSIGQANGTLSLREAAVQKAVEGQTTLEEVIRETAL